MAEQASKVLQAFRYTGGKSRLAPWIISYIPKHRLYVEPMGGSAAVLLSKPRSSYEVFNDIDQEICNFMLQLRDNHDKLLFKMIRTPFSHALYRQWRREFMEGKIPEDPIDRAARWVFTQEASFKGMWGKGWFSYIGARSYSNLIKRIDEMSRRLQGVALDVGMDYRVIVGKYDSPNTLFYFDPPFIIEDGTTPDYFAPYLDHKGFDHAALAELLIDKGLEGKWLLTYYEVPKITELYSEPGIYSVKRDAQVASAAIRGKPAPHRTVLLLANFPLEGMDK